MPETEQKKTNENNQLDVIHDYYDELKEERYRLAVDLRMMGMSCLDISRKEEIGVTYSRVRQWFMKGGICYDAFKQRQRWLASENRKRSKDFAKKLKTLASDALLILESEMKNTKNSGSSKGRIAGEVVKMAGLAAPIKIDPDSLDHKAGPSVIVTLPNNDRDKLPKS